MYKYSLSSLPSFLNPFGSYIFLSMGKSLQTDFKNYTSLHTSYSTLISISNQKLSSLNQLSSLKHKEKLKCRRGLLYSNKKRKLLKIIKKREEERLAKIKALQKRRKQLEALIVKLMARKKYTKKKIASIIRPTEGPIIRKFGEVKDKKVGTKLLNKGIDIKAKFKANVYAIATGEVVYEGEFLGYGKIIIIDHKNGFSSLYTYLEETLVTTGDKVEKGEVIGKVGKDSLTGETILHFELRKNGVAVDPLEYIK
jgi:septal ring factor EnvC (AmiA/AmiB activator)